MKIVINNFFKRINECEIKYTILHHIEHIYSKDDDIDFIVDCDRPTFIQFLKDFTSQNECFIGSNYTIDKNIYRFDLCFFNNDRLNKIELDCVCNGIGKDLLQINTKKLLKRRKKVNIEGNNFYKVSDKDEIEYYIKKKAFKNIDISQYINYFKTLDQTITEEDIVKKYKYWIKYFNSNTYKVKKNKNKLELLLKRLVEKPALSIGLLGPDGSGKSTIINELNKLPFFIYKYYFHLKPIKQKQYDTPTVVTDPHKYEPYSKPKSYIKLLYFMYQYNTGWLKNITALKIKSSLVIFDRYYDDLLVDFKRYRYGGSIAMAKFVRKFIPKPDLYFILTTDPKVIYERRQEVPFKELERQIKAYNNLADNKRYFQIDVNRTPQEITKDIITIIMRKMNERF